MFGRAELRVCPCGEHGEFLGFSVSIIDGRLSKVSRRSSTDVVFLRYMSVYVCVLVLTFLSGVLWHEEIGGGIPYKVLP